MLFSWLFKRFRRDKDAMYGQLCEQAREMQEKDDRIDALTKENGELRKIIRKYDPNFELNPEPDEKPTSKNWYETFRTTDSQTLPTMTMDTEKDDEDKAVYDITVGEDGSIKKTPTQSQAVKSNVSPLFEGAQNPLEGAFKLG